jgi:hypothetical protein
MSLRAADLTIDHVTAAGIDLNTMRASLAAVGIPSEYGGPHSNHATEMALTSFPDGSYLELIAIQPQADAAAVAAHYWSKHMKKNVDHAVGRSARGFRFRNKTPQARSCLSNPCARERRPTACASNGKPRPLALTEWRILPFLIRDHHASSVLIQAGKPTTEDFGGVARVVILVGI